MPYYNPSVVYGDWPYPDYPPLYFPPPAGFVAGAVLATGVAFGAGIAVGRAISWNYWRGGLGWGRNTIVNVDRTNINNVRVSHWEHNPAHRHGVHYRNDAVRQKYGKAAVGAGDRHLDFRGHGGEQVLKPGGDRPGTVSAGIGRSPSRRWPAPATGRVPATGRRSQGGPTVSQTATKGAPRAGGGAPRVAHRDTAFSHAGRGASARAHADRGRASLTSHRVWQRHELPPRAWAVAAFVAAAAAAMAADGGKPRHRNR